MGNEAMERLYQQVIKREPAAPEVQWVMVRAPIEIAVPRTEQLRKALEEHRAKGDKIQIIKE